jgi:hypothetical protein
MARSRSRGTRGNGLFQRGAEAVGGTKLAKFAAMGALIVLVPGAGIVVAAFTGDPRTSLRTGVQALTAGSPNLGRVAGVAGTRGLFRRPRG